MSSKKFKKNKNKSTKQPRKLNREGLAALQKCRFFIYLMFVFTILMMLYSPIANLFHVKETKILYGMVLMVACQIVVATMHLAKYNTTVEVFLSGREKDYANMYTARLRLCVLMPAVVLVVAVINHSQWQSGLMNTLLCLLNVAFVVMSLQNLTILQRNYV
jgi:hypothetical protein